MDIMVRISIKEGTRWLWNASQGYRVPILASILAGTTRIGISLTFVWQCKHLIDIATHQADGNIAIGLASMTGCIVLQLLLSSLVNRLYAHTEISLRNRLRQNLFEHILKSHWSGRETFHSGDMLNRMEEDVRTVTDLLAGSIPSAGITLFQLAGAALFLFCLDHRMAVVILLIMPLALLFSKLYMKRMRHLTREIRATDSRLQSHLQENLQHRTLISTLEYTSMAADMISTLQSGLKRLVMRRNSFSIFSGLMVQAGFALGYLTAFAWGIYGLDTGTVTFGTLTAFLQLVAQVQRPGVELARQIPAFISALTSVERIDELTSLPLEEQGEPLILKGKVGIRLENVTFAYPDGKRKVIEHFTHDFEPGSLTAVLGETGSGKSTMVRLMLALLRPDGGNITLYDERQSLPASPLTRRNFVYVPQGNTLVSGTLRDNLLLGNPEATDAQMWKALHMAAADFVHELPQGLDTPCGEMGTGLSEGQAQRIAIARGLLRPGNIVLLDEPTSSLDSDTEQTLLERLSHTIQGKTLIIITHQMQTARLCDKIKKMATT
ncbi:ABC transporter ATP-binding protein [Phocaeicola vulgatus]|uniref:ABC transporter ATP-binding protein n=1 Tax=Phocaeicola vulgatus TaxID=821 RepID=UPI003F8B858C